MSHGHETLEGDGRQAPTTEKFRASFWALTSTSSFSILYLAWTNQMTCILTIAFGVVACDHLNYNTRQDIVLLLMFVSVASEDFPSLGASALLRIVHS